MISPELLQSYSFFASLTDEHLKAISRAGEEKFFPKDYILFEENTNADKLLLLLDGRVTLFYNGRSNNAPICSIAPGGIFGVSSLIAPYRYTSSARVIMPVKVVEIDGASLRTMANKDPILDHALMQNVAAAVLARVHGAVGE